MQTYSEMQAELTSRLKVAANSTEFPTSRIQSLIKDAHLWATSLYPFRELTDPKTTTTNGEENYDYPSTYRSNSIWMLFVDGKEFHKKNWDGYIRWKTRYPTLTSKRIFADMGRQYFIFPKPVTGKVLDIYGQVQATQFSASGNTSIFSLSNEEGNEAIILKALAVAKNDNAKEQEAVGLLTKIFATQKDNGQFEQPLNTPLFNVPDFFGNGASFINNNWSVQNNDDDELF
jgi:hypothetical protein